MGTVTFLQRNVTVLLQKYLSSLTGTLTDYRMTVKSMTYTHKKG